MVLWRSGSTRTVTKQSDPDERAKRAASVQKLQ
jgi:hypothetical protein